jgi:hypothetical protein
LNFPPNWQISNEFTPPRRVEFAFALGKEEVIALDVHDELGVAQLFRQLDQHWPLVGTEGHDNTVGIERRPITRQESIRFAEPRLGEFEGASAVIRCAWIEWLEETLQKVQPGHRRDAVAGDPEGVVGLPLAQQRLGRIDSDDDEIAVGHRVDLLGAHHDVARCRHAGVVRNLSQQIEECLDFVG